MYKFINDLQGITGAIISENNNAQVGDMTTIGDIMMSKRKDSNITISDEIEPLNLLNGVVGLLDQYYYDTDKEYSDFSGKITDFLLDSDIINDAIEWKELSLHNIGLAIINVGNNFITINNSIKKVIEKKIEDKTFTVKDCEDILSTKLGLFISTDLKDRAINYLNDKKENEAKKKVSNKQDSNLNIKVTDKKALMELIKTNRISFNVLYTLIESNEITLFDLMAELEPEKVTKILDEFFKIQQSKPKQSESFPVTKDGDGEEKKKRCDCKEKCDIHASKVDNDIISNKNLVEEAMNAKAISGVEKMCRERILKGIATDAEILLAVKNNHLNPFFLDGTIKKSEPDRYKSLCVKILEQNLFTEDSTLEEAVTEAMKFLFDVKKK